MKMSIGGKVEELLLPKIETDVGQQGETCTDIYVCVNKYCVAMVTGRVAFIDHIDGRLLPVSKSEAKKILDAKSDISIFFYII